ncbi:toll-like receptor 2 type-2 [Elgaria multicarinata webbii]|uniref:toll-like receptor 2 type-2 n=1 Tax=Elgaria multicarinata webbii TaxID=159646 RepID=UPI002FCCCF5D
MIVSHWFPPFHLDPQITMTEPAWSLWVICVVGAVSLSAQQINPLCDAAHFCNYSARALHAIPPGLRDNVTGLDLASNSIEQIREEDLKFAVQLRTLLLQSNLIRTIDEDAFRFLVKLEHLDLSRNKLTHLSPSWFRHLSSLQKLNIKGNYYSSLGGTPLFSDLQKLRYLYLGNDDHFSALWTRDLEGISVLEELEIEGRNIKKHERGALQPIKFINHIILNVPSIPILYSIISDVRNSVVCLELRNMQWLDIPSFSSLDLVPVAAKKVVLQNIEFSDKSVVHFAPILAMVSQLHELEIIDCSLQGSGLFNGIKSSSSTLRIITIRNLANDAFYTFSDLDTVKPLAGDITKLTVENAKVYLVPCPLAQAFHSLLYLDLSVNLLLDPYLSISLCPGGWPKLQALNVSQNSLKQIDTVAQSSAHMVNLSSLDISQNSFQEMPNSCVWPKRLKYLNISGCKLSKLTPCIPQSLEVLDVSNNNLQAFRLTLPHLQELHIKNNKLAALPDAVFIPSARILNIRENKVIEFSEEQLEKFTEMESLDARYNAFQCSCTFVSFIKSQPRIPNISVGWPENYICDSPDHVRGQKIGAAQLPLAECHLALMMSLICILLLLIILGVASLCYKFHVFWYTQMIWAWLQAKRKPQRAHNQEIDYDAFVSYSEQDSEWVENVMVQELEQAHPPFKLCLHKRDFLPGKWIMDNIVDSIEKSKKTLFVLSEHFVKSEWCKYELDFSHFRFFDEKNDAVILVLLEPIPDKSVPKRFCKLRKLMNTKTYLEWPRDEDQQPLFWFNLKTAIKSY